MSTAWRNQIRTDVVSKYHRDKFMREERMRVNQQRRQRLQEDKELTMPVDELMTRGDFNESR